MLNEYSYPRFCSYTVDEQIKLVINLQDPLVFAEKLLDIKLFDYQKDIITDNSKRLLIRKGRQVGISYTLALKTIIKAINIPNVTVAIVSPSQRQSSLVFKYIMTFFRTHPLLRPEIESKNSRCSQTVIELPNGSTIYSLPCGNDGHTIRGISIPKNSILIVDEAAYIPEKVWEAIDYFTAAGGQEIISSTPLGKHGRFFDLSTDKDYKKYLITSLQNPLIDVEWIESRKKYKSYKTEILGEFGAGEGTFFDEDQVRACINADLSWEADPKSVNGLNKYMGIDVALEIDPTVITVVAKHEKRNKYIPFFIKAYKKDNGKDSYKHTYTPVKSYDEILDEIIKVNIKYSGITYAAVDATYNPYLAERLEKKMTTYPIKFNSSAKNGNPMKTELMYTLLGAIVEKKVELPNHPDLIRQLINYEHEITENKNIKFSATDEDFIDSLALSLYTELAAQELDNFAVTN